MERNEQYFQELDNKRIESINNRDAVSYFNVCNEAGIEPEFPELYELGEMFQRRLEKSIVEHKRKRIPGRDFYVPKYAYELKDWISDYCGKNNRPFPKNFSKMRKKQLYAIYFSIMAD